MLVSFYARNYRSIGERAGVSMVAVDADKDRPGHLIHIPGSKCHCLRTGVLYGANASGKSTFCKALRYLRRLAVESKPDAKTTGTEKFAFLSMSPDTSDFDIRFVSRNRLYRYFVTLTERTIRNEVLVDETEADNMRTLFERGLAEDGASEINFPDEESVVLGRKMRSLASLGVSPVQSFLSAVKMLIARGEDRGSLEPVIEWFSRLTILSPGSNFRHLERIVDDARLQDFVGRKLSDCSTGIRAIRADGACVSEADLRVALQALPKDELSRMLDTADARCVVRSGDDVVVFDRRDGNVRRTTVRAAHVDGANGTLSLNQESDGTRRMLNLLPALYALGETDCVYVIDEIDRSMHPLLTREFVASFLSGAPRGQLLMTTHDNNLLDCDLLRRDEVWFAEKDRNQATHYFSLAEFKPRTKKSQGDYYLEGRFGGIPVLRNCRILSRPSGGDR